MENWQGPWQEQLSRASGGARVRATRYERTMAARTLWHGSVRGRAAVRARARARGNMTGKHMMEGWRESPPHMWVDRWRVSNSGTAARAQRDSACTAATRRGATAAHVMNMMETWRLSPHQQQQQQHSPARAAVSRHAKSSATRATATRDARRGGAKATRRRRQRQRQRSAARSSAATDSSGGRRRSRVTSWRPRWRRRVQARIPQAKPTPPLGCLGSLGAWGGWGAPT